MRANFRFINIKEEIKDDELIEIIKQYPNAPIFGDKNFLDRINKLKQAKENVK